MTTESTSRTRDARAEDVDDLIALWGLLFDGAAHEAAPWRGHARDWLGSVVVNRQVACFPVVEVDAAIVACAVGTLELGVPNPHCPRGRTARLANVVTLPEHRKQGHATALVEHVVDWARSIQADRVDLSATPEGRRIYARSGFELTSAPRMKLML
ncbi:GNAT family N-acetyltransferase [Terrabacter sp. 2RAF25]|uniref:GNAT family N-acetyltransferase n=1 Tax=Terrabacter sp. 2RAF25 TaxID=3232998 RepID=UPI003F9E7B1F